jgi:hypothetical protein
LDDHRQGCLPSPVHVAVHRETDLDKTLAATGLGFITDECTGRNRALVRIDAEVRRGGQTRRESQTATAVWPGPPPTDPPEGCGPNPGPDPDPNPDPPYCRTKPWLCEPEPT